ncbi:hypothetical protein B9Z55_012146 [Caenorhabditis nigoni]|uniref:Uncharacterized protein n=1 Tax=Caenorhabditis nigoni TaxID=1611254 RepID=A0A2G5TW18_9PELO|nr:hypothetical protein B9Z55_012146 [Caenorhabditis nigoni]
MGKFGEDTKNKKCMKNKFEHIYRHRREQNNRNAEKWRLEMQNCAFMLTVRAGEYLSVHSTHTDVRMLDWQVRNWREEMENCAFMRTVRSGDHVEVRYTHTDVRERGLRDWMNGQYHPGNILSAGETFRVVVRFQ